MEQDYIKNLRKKVGHEPLILNFAGGVLVNDQDEILLQKRSDFKSWGLPALNTKPTAIKATTKKPISLENSRLNPK